MTTIEATKKSLNARAVPEVKGGTFMQVREIIKAPNKEQLLIEAGEIIRSEIKEVLRGIGPICGRDRLLQICAAVIDEDFDADGPQTPLPVRDWEQ
jgi:hypothetical protein